VWKVVFHYYYCPICGLLNTTIPYMVSLLLLCHTWLLDFGLSIHRSAEVLRGPKSWIWRTLIRANLALVRDFFAGRSQTFAEKSLWWSQRLLPAKTSTSLWNRPLSDLTIPANPKSFFLQGNLPGNFFPRKKSSRELTWNQGGGKCVLYICIYIHKH